MDNNKTTLKQALSYYQSNLRACMYWDDIELLGCYIDVDTLSDMPQEVYKHTKLRYEAEYIKSIRVLIKQEQLCASTLSKVVKIPHIKYL